jgi:hypothetical protein
MTTLDTSQPKRSGEWSGIQAGKHHFGETSPTLRKVLAAQGCSLTASRPEKRIGEASAGTGGAFQIQAIKQ